MRLLGLFLSLVSVVAQADVAAGLDIDAGFVRAAIQQQRNSAAFMRIHNNGESAAIVSAASPVAEIVELHTHINDNGVMRMRKIARIDLPTGVTVNLEPGGLHVMLLGLNRDLNEHDSVPLTLLFSDGSEKPLQLPVRNMMMPRMQDAGMHERGLLMNH